jgi:transcriptional regulator with XRE-family HTH domain
MALHERLKLRAKELGLADAEVARRTGLDPRRYGHYVLGRREPDAATLVRIARVLKTTPDGLLLSQPEAGTPRSRALARLLSAAQVLDDRDLDSIVAQVEAVVELRQSRPTKRRRRGKSANN